MGARGSDGLTEGASSIAAPVRRWPTAVAACRPCHRTLPILEVGTAVESSGDIRAACVGLAEKVSATAPRTSAECSGWWWHGSRRCCLHTVGRPNA